MFTWNMMHRSFMVALCALLLSNLGVASAADAPVVSFRLSKQKSAHFDDTAAAKRHYDTLRKIGCKAKQASHGDHYDVVYSAPTWKKLKFKSLADADKWAKWLARSGFETIHIQPPTSGHLEIVSYRLPKGSATHHDSSSKANDLADTYRMLGCEVKLAKHAGHHDVSFRCDKWRTVGFESHEAAHRWQDWLDSAGFETKHEHNKKAQSKKATSRR